MDNKELVFRVMVTSIELLSREIERYNRFNKTNFKIINMVNDEIPFCDISVSEFKVSDIFDLGFSLALYEEELRQKGEIDW